MNAAIQSLLDIDAFPLVQVRDMPRDLPAVERWLEEVEAVLAVERNFALVYPPFPAGEGEGDQRARKRLVLWLKENRQRFVEHCRGHPAQRQRPTGQSRRPATAGPGATGGLWSAGERGAGPRVRPRHGEGSAERSGEGNELVRSACA